VDVRRVWMLREKERQDKNPGQHRMNKQSEAKEGAGAHGQAGRDYSEPSTQHPARSCRRVVTTSRR